MAYKVKLDVEIYEGIVNNIETTGSRLLDKKDCHQPSDRVVNNAVIPDYVVAYEGMIKTINYLMDINQEKLVTLMKNVLAYHKDIDQTMSNQLSQAGDVFASDGDN